MSQEQACLGRDRLHLDLEASEQSTGEREALARCSLAHPQKLWCRYCDLIKVPHKAALKMFSLFCSEKDQENMQKVPERKLE